LKAEEASTRREQQAAQARFDAGRAKITDVREAQARGMASPRAS
jgi:outer membrane protein